MTTFDAIPPQDRPLLVRVAIPHFCRIAPNDGDGYGSSRADAAIFRAVALSRCLGGVLSLARGVEEGRWGGAETEERKQHLCRSEPSEPSINTFAGSRRAGEYRASLSRSPDKVWFICMLRLGEGRSTRPNNVFGRPLPATK